MEQFVRYVADGVSQLEERLSRQPELKQQIEEVIRESLNRTTMEALELEQSVAILTGREIASAVVACMRCLETFDDLEELGSAAELGDDTVHFLRYLTARYGPVLKAFRRRTHYPHGWHKFGHAVSQSETGQTHLQLKIMRNDDATLLLEDDSESILRLVNLMLKSLESADDYAAIDGHTLQDFTERYAHLIDRAAVGGSTDRTEH